MSPLERTFVDTKRTFKRLRPKLIRTALTTNVLVIILVVIALSVDKWVVVAFPKKYYEPLLKRHILEASFGAMSYCYREVAELPGIDYRHCSSFWLMPTSVQIDNDPFTDEIIAGLRKTEFAFLVIMIAFDLGSLAAGLYSVRAYRYMYKRLTSVLYLIAAVCTMVCLELVNNMVRYCRDNRRACYPPGATHSYAISTFIMWFCFAALISCAILFLISSSKLKGANAADEREAIANMPFELGRTRV